MQAFKNLHGKLLVLAQENVDTDQIIPARYLTTTRFDGLGEYLFADWRFDSDGNERADCVFNSTTAKQSPILVAGRNFGCGSSREHAPRALLDYGFRVVISSEIADIFRSNSLNVGLLPIILTADEHAQLLAMDGVEIAVDLQAQKIMIGDDVEFKFSTEAFSRHCLLMGMDRFDLLVDADDDIKAFEAGRAA